MQITKVSISLPFGIGSAEWQPDPTERRAAWSLYVELVTRIAVQSLEPEGGLPREALSSLHELFPTTREILREAGPGVGASRESVGGIAITVLNHGLRPVLAKWHPRLQAWEARRSLTATPGEHAEWWPEELEFRRELESLRGELDRYADALATIAGVER
jgi:hypothetical protein